MRSTRSYQELAKIDTFEGRFDYLVLGGEVGRSTFGYERWLNQAFYTSREWKQARQAAIARDEARDLGIPDFEISHRILVHHINPITPEDLEDGNPLILDLNNLITVSHDTHNAIHYGDRSKIRQAWVPRSENDTIPWRT